MGSIEVLVPPDVRVECDGDAILGLVRDCRDRSGAGHAEGAPADSRHGHCLSRIGGSEGIVDPNAPSWIQQLRSRWNEVRGISSGGR